MLNLKQERSEYQWISIVFNNTIGNLALVYRFIVDVENGCDKRSVPDWFYRKLVNLNRKAFICKIWKNLLIVAER